MAHSSDKSHNILSEGQPDVRLFDYLRKNLPRQIQAPKNNQLKARSKPKKHYSVAGIFATSTKSTNRSRKRGKEKNECNTTIINLLNDQMSEVGCEIVRNAVGTFDEVLDLNLKNLATIKEKDQRFKDFISEAISKLVAPLISRQGELKISTNHSDSRISSDINTSATTTATYNIANYKQVVDAELKNLKNYWKQWEDIHDEYLALGIEIFGSQSCNDNSVRQQKGFKDEMELLQLHQKTKIIELENEIEKLGTHVLQKMRKSEKDLDVVIKREKNRVLASLVSNL
ncbi:hypothetical protein EV44_g4506 [Erysiphe necator]|uniref:Uncharacterized protein n=1 Tax=Uncinula necator TaxID=52586 RepID=A0A0B1P5W2_UNCNE|nr:hypothetical protein EV44_g4506 [Erysiphe necator]